MHNPIIRSGQFLFKYRSAVFPLVLVLLLVILPPRLPFGSAMLDIGFDAVGILILISGLALRALVIGLQYIKRGGQNKQVYADDLVTGGIFSASRNPLYLGNLLLLLGLLVVLGNPWALLVGLPLGLGAYYAIVAAEEAFLVAKFGDAYRDYCSAVNRWWPVPGRVVAAVTASEFNWYRVIVKDYNTEYLWLSAALALLVYEHIVIPAYHQGWAEQKSLAVIFAALTIAYLAARLLKKKRLLTQNGWCFRSEI